MSKVTIQDKLLKVITDSKHPNTMELLDEVIKLYQQDKELDNKLAKIENKYRVNKEEHLKLKQEVDRLRNENMQKYKVTQIYSKYHDSERYVTFTNIKDPLDYFTQEIPYEVYNRDVYKFGKKFKMLNPNNYKL